MSHQAERGDRRRVADRRRGLEMSPAEPPFRDPPDHDDPLCTTDHYAHVYETPEERLTSVVPFLRCGLERGERCLYVADGRSTERSQVVDALEEAGVDVAAALETEQLAFETVQTTYLRERPFDPEAMVDYYAHAVDVALDSFEGFRVVAGTDWLEEASIDSFMAYEGRVNTLFEEHQATALCLYDRSHLQPSVIRDVVRTHPHLIYDGTVCENFYYIPPAELTEPDEPDREVDRLLGTLRDRTHAKTEVAEHKRFLRELNEVMASPDRPFEEKLQSMFELGCDRFDLDLGAMARVDTGADWFEVEYVSHDHEHFEPGVELPLSETYCTAATDIRAAGSVADPREDGYDDITVYRDFGIRTYLGTYIEVDGDSDRTFFFVSSEPRSPDFTDDERSFVRLMGQWAKYELEQQRRERDLRTLYETAADTDRPFEEKLQALFELGCDRLGMDVGGIARVDVDADLFVVEHVSGDDDNLVPGEQYPLSETYCYPTATGKGTVAITDPADAGYEGTLCYDRFGVQAYLGTRLELDGTDDRTFWFVSRRPREQGFSCDERTFHHLIGQWIQYELERQHHELALERTIDRLRQANDRLQQFAYAASHDLQEPLRMVSSYLQLLEDQYGEALDDDAHEYLGFAVDGADRMRSMVEDLLAYSEVEQNGGEFEDVDCTDLLDQVLADLKLQIEEEKAEVVVESLPTVAGDPEQLEQLFSNLVSNALKYTDGVTPRVEVSVQARDDGWDLSVTDNGIGIPADKTDQIFGVFNRLHHPDEYPGTGIGLALCQEIVENHGGTIDVESEPGRGSTFTVTLPRRSTG